MPARTRNMMQRVRVEWAAERPNTSRRQRWVAVFGRNDREGKRKKQEISMDMYSWMDWWKADEMMSTWAQTCQSFVAISVSHCTKRKEKNSWHCHYICSGTEVLQRFWFCSMHPKKICRVSLSTKRNFAPPNAESPRKCGARGPAQNAKMSERAILSFKSDFMKIS